VWYVHAVGYAGHSATWVDDAWLLPSRSLLHVVLMTQAHAVFHAPEQQRVTTMRDDVVNLGRGHDMAVTLAHMAERIAAQGLGTHTPHGVTPAGQVVPPPPCRAMRDPRIMHRTGAALWACRD